MRRYRRPMRSEVLAIRPESSAENRIPMTLTQRASLPIRVYKCSRVVAQKRLTMTKGSFSAPSLEVPQFPVIDRERDYALLRSSAESPMDFATVKQPYSRGTGLRIHCEDPTPHFVSNLGEGYSD